MTKLISQFTCNTVRHQNKQGDMRGSVSQRDRLIHDSDTVFYFLIFKM